MDIVQIVVLALVQGLTEFLPVSSSAHLILVPVLLDWPDQGLAFDVAVHIGTLSAVIFYFRKEIAQIIRDWIKSLAQKKPIGDSNLGWGIIVATVPAIVAGFLLKDLIENETRGAMVIATTTILFGLLLWWADYAGKQTRSEHSLSLSDVVLIGLAQALALIPGTSRSGITITAALLLGLTRDAAARFSFLLSIPTIFGAGLLKTKDLVEQSNPVDWTSIGLGTALSALSAYLCIHYFLKLINAIGLAPFVYYRLLLGLVLIVLFI